MQVNLKTSRNRILPLLTCLAFLPFFCFSQSEDEAFQNIAKDWVAIWGEKWYERYHDDVDAQYPGGRSNLFHDMYVQEALKNRKEHAWIDWKITNRQYLFDHDWFAAEWFYQSTQESTGIVQVESTLAFGRIEDDSLISWIEYFDDKVGEYQSIGVMRQFDKENELPFPWPANTQLQKKYRP